MSSSLILNSNNEFLNWIVMCDEKWLLYNNWQQPTQWLDHEETPKHFPKPKLHQKQVMVTVWWSAASLMHYSFLNPGETNTSEKYAQQVNEMHPKMQCLQPALVNRKGPILLHDNTQSRPHITQPTLPCWAMKFCLICHIHQLTTTSSSNTTTFFRENTSTTSKRQKMLSKSSLNPEAWIFMLQE